MPTSLTRRALLERLAAAGALPALPPVLVACANRRGADSAADSALPDDGFPRYRWEGPAGPETLFEHGVASGDPLADAVVLWTAVSPDGDDPVELFLEVAASPDFRTRLAVETYAVTSATGWCFKVDVTRLEPGTTYYYRWSAQGRTSPIGRTRTLPETVDHLRLAVCSCSNFAAGWFHAYHYLSQRQDLDLVMHLGDYIYEYGTDEYGTARACEPPHEVLSLADYRLRYSQYRRDPDLQEAHRQHPWITVWDDHEFTNDPLPAGAGAENHDEGEGVWADRVAIAVQVYDEWLPTRVADPRKLWRAFDLGDLARVCVADIKYPLVNDLGEQPTMLGEEQHAWLDGAIAQTTQPWFLLAQAQSFTDAAKADGTGSSAWGAQPDSRRRVLDAVAAAGIPNCVVLTGDTHRTRAVDYTEDPHGAYDPATGATTEAVEFETGSITSDGGPQGLDEYPNHFWAEGVYRHYLVLDITPERLQADWFGFPDFLKREESRPPDGEEWRKGFTTASGANHLVEASAPAADKDEAPALAP